MQLPNNNAGEKNDQENSSDVPVMNLGNSQHLSQSGGNIGIQNNVRPNIIPMPLQQEPDFSEFMWMASEDLEDFDQKVIRELDQHYGIDSASGLEAEEEDFLQQMLEEEEEKNTVYFPNAPINSDGCVNDLSKRLLKMDVSDGLAAQSNLNPFAAEFIPGQGFQNPSMAAPIAVMAQPDTHPMTSQIYATNMSASLQGTGLNAMQPNLMWRQTSPHMSPRYSAPVQAQLNGQGVRGVYAANGPLYVSNMPVSMFPMMNGGPFMRPPTNRFQQPDAPDRCIEDEGYEE